MTQKNFIKQNFALIIGLTLPVLLMFGFMFAANMPQTVSDPPKYDLVFAVTEYPNVSGGIPVAVRLVVRDGALKAEYTRNVPATPNSYPYNYWKKLYLYEAKTQKVKELTFGYPADMNKITGTREDIVDATKGMKLDTTLQSPDGYELTTDGYDHYGFFNEIFWGGGYTNAPILKKGSARVKLATGDGRTTFSYTNPEFVGWVVGTVSMTAKQDALVEVTDIIRRHGLTLGTSAALKEAPEFRAEKSGGILSRIFGYIGGIFVFAGLCIFVQMQWNDLSAMGRILITLGPGFCAFVMALVCASDARFEKAATPLFLAAAVVEPAGIVVMMREYAHGADPEYGVLFMCFVMAIQQGFTFWAKDRTVLALTTIIFGLGFFATAFDIMHVHSHLIGVVIGLSLVCIGWSLDHSRHKSIAGLVYFFGSTLFLSSAWDWMHDTAADVLFLALSCGTIFISTVTRSRSLLVVGTFALLFYLGEYIEEHFAHDLNAPVILMIVGFLLIGVGAVAVKINNKYIKQKG